MESPQPAKLQAATLQPGTCTSHYKPARAAFTRFERPGSGNSTTGRAPRRRALRFRPTSQLLRRPLSSAGDSAREGRGRPSPQAITGASALARTPSRTSLPTRPLGRRPRDALWRLARPEAAALPSNEDTSWADVSARHPGTCSPAWPETPPGMNGAELTANYGCPVASVVAAPRESGVQERGRCSVPRQGPQAGFPRQRIRRRLLGALAPLSAHRPCTRLWPWFWCLPAAAAT